MIRVMILTLTAGLAAFAFPAGPAAAQTAGYTATFDATWSAATHPTDFPPNPHFSGLVGGTHDGTVSFWDPGQPASLGIKRMAEWGSQTELLAEVQTAIDAGQAGETIADDPLWTVPGFTSVDFTVSPDHPLVTLVAMIAPSPDWFVGVRGLDLRDGAGWADEIVVELFAFDAGTDSGPTYTSNDQATVPPEPIFEIEGYPFAAGVPIGTLTFTLNHVADVPPSAPFAASAFPNPFNPATTIAWDLPRAGRLRVAIHDIAGRHLHTLHEGITPEGPGRVTWDGRDTRGRSVPSGTYLVRLGGSVESRTLKVMLAK